MNEIDLSVYNKDATYILGCSFGPDSMMLLDLLIKNNFKIIVAMVNYHIRNESDDEEKSLRDYCFQRQIPFYLRNSYYKKEDGNFQSYARDFRYSYFNELYLNFEASGLFLGHHLDDSIETYLMQKRRGLNLFYYGIKPETTVMDMHVYRPLIHLCKEEILDYCKKHQVPYAIDQSNATNNYLRNEIRNTYLNTISAKEKKSIIDEMTKRNKELVLVANKIDSAFAPFEIIQLSDLENLSDLERNYLFYKFFTRVLPPKMYKTKYQYEINKLIHSKKPNVHIAISHYLIQKEYDIIKIITKKELSGYEYIIERPKRLETPYFILDFTKKHRIDRITIGDFPLRVRTFHKGDKYVVSNYLVEVRRLFIDWKMPLSLRRRWPIVINKKKEIVYIPRYRKDYVPNDNDLFQIK